MSAAPPPPDEATARRRHPTAPRPPSPANLIAPPPAGTDIAGDDIEMANAGLLRAGLRRIGAGDRRVIVEVDASSLLVGLASALARDPDVLEGLRLALEYAENGGEHYRELGFTRDGASDYAESRIFEELAYVEGQTGLALRRATAAVSLSIPAAQQAMDRVLTAMRFAHSQRVERPALRSVTEPGPAAAVSR